MSLNNQFKSLDIYLIRRSGDACVGFATEPNLKFTVRGIHKKGGGYLFHRNMMKPGAADRFVGDVSSQVIP